MLRLDELDGLYHLDPVHSALGFTVRHAGISRVHGTFDSFHGYAVFDPSDVHNSALMVSVRTSSINTQHRDRDAHLRSPDFFDVEAHPAITYVGVGFELVDETRVRIRGDLTIKGVTRPLELLLDYTGSATDPFGNRRIGFEGATRISRKDFGLTWNAALESGGWLVSDEVAIDIDCSAVNQAENQAENRAVDRAAEPGAAASDDTALGDLAMTPDIDAADVDPATGRPLAATRPRRAAAEADDAGAAVEPAGGPARPRRAAVDPGDTDPEASGSEESQGARAATESSDPGRRAWWSRGRR